MSLLKNRIRSFFVVTHSIAKRWLLLLAAFSVFGLLTACGPSPEQLRQAVEEYCKTVDTNCKGEAGKDGTKGVQGEKGDKGEKGEQGEKGDPGTNGTNGTDASMAEFVGFSKTKTDGNAGGWAGMKTLCDNDYAGSRMCTQAEAMVALQNGKITAATFGTVDPNTGGAAWIGGSTYAQNSNGSFHCGGWRSNKAGDSTNPNNGAAVTWAGPNNPTSLLVGHQECRSTWPVACCK
ncbi:MAG: collagen-like protein [Deltaproteobacteria bacterium]|nr:MAG: collagen-like protein [Deltaproteobacteria bacterium]